MENKTMCLTIFIIVRFYRIGDRFFFLYWNLFNLYIVYIDKIVY